MNKADKDTAIELINECISKSKDRYNREHGKLKAFQHLNNFFTEAGVKDRSQSVKYKVLLKERERLGGVEDGGVVAGSGKRSGKDSSRDSTPQVTEE